jgi:hypothetical protein
MVHWAPKKFDHSTPKKIGSTSISVNFTKKHFGMTNEKFGIITTRLAPPKVFFYKKLSVRKIKKKSITLKFK